MRGPWPMEQPVLADEQVLLRQWRPDDVDDVFLACQDQDIQNFTQVPVPYLREHAEGFVANAPGLWAAGTAAQFAVTDSTSGRVLGSMGLQEADHPNRRIEAGYWTAPWGRSRGNTRRALRLATQWALTRGGFDTVALQVEQANPRSSAVAVAVGYRPDDLPIEHMELKGTLRAFVGYRITLAELR